MYTYIYIYVKDKIKCFEFCAVVKFSIQTETIFGRESVDLRTTSSQSLWLLGREYP